MHTSPQGQRERKTTPANVVDSSLPPPFRILFPIFSGFFSPSSTGHKDLKDRYVCVAWKRKKRDSIQWHHLCEHPSLIDSLGCVRREIVLDIWPQNGSDGWLLYCCPNLEWKLLQFEKLNEMRVLHYVARTLVIGQCRAPVFLARLSISLRYRSSSSMISSEKHFTALSLNNVILKNATLCFHLIPAVHFACTILLSITFSPWFASNENEG